MKSCTVVSVMAETKKTVKKAPKAKSTKEVEAPINGAFAIIETGGKQYRAVEGETIKIEKLKDKEYKEGDTVVFDKVLLVDNGTDVTNIGTPYLDGAKVSATVSSIGRDQKVIVIKYKQKSRYFKKNGHRQPHFKVTINKIA